VGSGWAEAVGRGWAVAAGWGSAVAAVVMEGCSTLALQRKEKRIPGPTQDGKHHYLLRRSGSRRHRKLEFHIGYFHHHHC
jgi:hypothetical protein